MLDLASVLSQPEVGSQHLIAWGTWMITIGGTLYSTEWLFWSHQCYGVQNMIPELDSTRKTGKISFRSAELDSTTYISINFYN